MALTVMSFFATNEAPLADGDLRRALGTAREIAPPGSRAEARALESTYLQMTYPDPDGEPEVIREGDATPRPFSGGVVTVWFDEALDNLELKAQQAARQLHAALGARGTGTFDTRRHLDLVGDDWAAPTLQAVILIRRRPGLDRDSFIQYYRTHHVPLAKSLKPRFTRYTTFRTLEAEGDFPFDCVTYQEYPSLDEIRAHMGNRLKSDDAAHSDVGRFNQSVWYNIGQRTMFG